MLIQIREKKYIYIYQSVGGVSLVARISRKTEVPSALTLRVEVKEPTEDEKHSGSDHSQIFTHINTPRSSGRRYTK